MKKTLFFVLLLPLFLLISCDFNDADQTETIIENWCPYDVKITINGVCENTRIFAEGNLKVIGLRKNRVYKMTIDRYKKTTSGRTKIIGTSEPSVVEFKITSNHPHLEILPTTNGFTLNKAL